MEEKKKKMPKEDIALYRLLAIIVFGIAVFVFSCFIGDSGMWNFFSSVAVKIILIALFAVALFFTIRGIVVGNPDNRLFTVGGVCAVLLPALMVLAFYHFTSTGRGDLLKIVAVASTVVAFVKVVYPKNYFFVSLASALAFAAMFFMKLPNVSSKYFMNTVYKILAYPMGIVVPACVLVLMFLAKKNKGKLKLGKILKIAYKQDKAMFCFIKTIAVGSHKPSAFTLFIAHTRQFRRFYLIKINKQVKRVIQKFIFSIRITMSRIYSQSFQKLLFIFLIIHIPSLLFCCNR